MMLSMALFLVPTTGAESGLTGGMQPIHLNMKEASDLSPETWGDNTRAAIKEKPPRSWPSSTPGDCFYAAYEACRISIKYMTPVMLLTDGYLANGSEPWSIPDSVSYTHLTLPTILLV